ncbi:hypothetical protein GDO78_022410 [Eleutherodactylus coqui]|uniref:Uncharacterized protein n=1 Tax=Eleutherodactylus coqui TaxID=57060 RepID=A0A8J6B2L9_ELECQ|nr:hypothetical protein GDO78_022410 [Eleutherodactylus coqui]
MQVTFSPVQKVDCGCVVTATYWPDYSVSPCLTSKFRLQFMNKTAGGSKMTMGIETGSSCPLFFSASHSPCTMKLLL